MPFQNNNVLASYNDVSIMPLFNGIGLLSDMVVELSFYIDYGLFQLNFRENESGTYAVVVRSTGEIELYRSGFLIQSSSLNTSYLDSWHTLRASIVGQEIRVAIDGTEAIVFTDSMPLPAGLVSMSGEVNLASGYLLDNVNIWANGETGEIASPQQDSVSQFSSPEYYTTLATSQEQLIFTKKTPLNQYQFKWDIYLANPDGTNLRGITGFTAGGAVTGDGNNREPAVSPNGQFIAFTSDRSPSTNPGINIFVMNSDGSNVHPVTTGNVAKRNPQWSADGTKILYEAGSPANIYVMNSNGTNVIALTSGSTNYAAYWSPSGTQIAFTSNRSGSLQLYVMNGDGSNIHPITSVTTTPIFHSWSFDGTKILYSVSNPSGPDRRVYVASPTGSGSNEVTSTNGLLNPIWATNTQLVFHKFGSTSYDIFRTNIDSTNQTNLTNTANDTESNPSLSPDGTRIFYLRAFATAYMMNSDGSNQHSLSIQFSPGDELSAWKVLVLGQVDFSTNTPPALATWQQLATVFPLPLTTTPQSRLSDPDFVDRAYAGPGTPTPNPTSVQPLCSRDVNRPGGGANFPAISSAPAEVMIVDLASGQGDNQNLGNFVVIRIRIASLHPNVKQSLVAQLSQNSANANIVYLINANVGWLWIGYAHLNSVSISGWTPSIYPTVPANGQLGLSGATGLELLTPAANPHLDISAYYISGAVGGIVRNSLPTPIATSFAQIDPRTREFGLDPIAAGVDLYQIYFEFFNQTAYGLVELIDPLWLWPLLQDGATFANGIDLQCP